jgi:hypothetical protein
MCLPQILSGEIRRIWNSSDHRLHQNHNRKTVILMDRYTNIMTGASTVLSIGRRLPPCLLSCAFIQQLVGFLGGRKAHYVFLLHIL